MKPIYTEKSSRLAKEGKYTFLVDRNMTKTKIKEMVFKLFGVQVKDVRTIKIGGGIKKKLQRKKDCYADQEKGCSYN